MQGLVDGPMANTQDQLGGPGVPVVSLVEVCAPMQAVLVLARGAKA